MSKSLMATAGQRTDVAHRFIDIDIDIDTRTFALRYLS